MGIESMIGAIRSAPKTTFGAGATLRQINSAAKEIACQFPRDYQRFLQEFGWARIGNNEIYGLGNDVPRHIDLIRNTIAERTLMNPTMPNYLIPIMNDGTGNHFCLDCSRMNSNRECPITFWDHEAVAAGRNHHVADFFSDWIIGIVQGK